MKKLLCILLMFTLTDVFSQNHADILSVEKIMRDPKWIGTSPSNPFWSHDGKYLFFYWNPEKAPSDSLYCITRENLVPQKANYELRHNKLPASNVTYNEARTMYTYAKDGDIYLGEAKTGKEKRITQTVEEESNPVFSFEETKIVYSRNQDLYAWDITSGLTTQLTNFQKGASPVQESKTSSGRRGQVSAKDEKMTAEEKWLMQDQLENFDVLRSRKEKRDLADSASKWLPKPKEIKAIYLEDKFLSEVNISPDGNFISYRLFRPAKEEKRTIVPNYVTENGYTQDIPGRAKVGETQGSYEFYILDLKKDSVIGIKTDQLPGIYDLPAYQRYYSGKDTGKSVNPRKVIYLGLHWSPKGSKALLDIMSQDYKDRWLMQLEANSGKMKTVDHQHDDAWIGGPGIGFFFGGGAHLGWLDENRCWYQSETSGYSHLYTANLMTGEKKQLTHGNYEVQEAHLSQDKKTFFIVTNEVHPGEQQYYRLPVSGGKAERVTENSGAHQVWVSPDEKQIAFLYSYSNKPWELYLQDNAPGTKSRQVTNMAMSDEFKQYPWRDPELITFTASDGATVYARLYRPAVQNEAKSGVIFVHGAGYLQNAHKWWSSYFREYMFNNLLADKGYTILDIDYRGSSGYGRDWRTAIYRHMGGKDLSDQVDGAKYLSEKYGVNPNHIGLYGGSYGGFITLMAMFTQSNVFAAGAGLRCVTDWANYNHGYTAEILNEPFNDSIAYKQSSPIYFANGLKGHLLMCHGMVDQNVHFQDIVKLTQRLIELGKDNWELAVYPMEDHGFVEPSSWTDEYKRILKLFETYLK